MIAGTVVSGLVVGTASVMTDIPGAGAPEATALEVPAGSEFDQARDDTQADLPETQETPDPSDVARVAAPEPDDLSMIETDATTSAAQPVTSDTEVALNAPTEGDTGVGITVETDSPILPSPQANAPEAPVAEEDLSISTVPAQPVQPDVSGDETVFATPEVAETSDTATDSTETTAPDQGVETPVKEVETATSEPAGDQADATNDDQSAASAAGVETDRTTVEVQDQVTEPAAPVTNAPELATNDTADDAPIVQEEVAAPTQPALPSGTIENIAPNITTNRLPSVVATPEPAPDADAEAGDAPEIAGPLPGSEDLPPLDRFAAEFENPDGKPLMSIVLIDDGSSPIGLDALKSFPYPLSFAVDTGWSGANAAMRKYRDAGFEVLAMIDMPKDAEATDTEVSMQTYLQRVPEAVAVMEGEDAGLQTTREAAEQLAQILRDTGHGAVMFPNGLNTAQKLIAREGVPSASVFRDFDAKGQNATVIRRFLDQAAFRAGQEEQGVILVGRLRADTISALLLWGLQDRAGRVAVAPVSAVLSPE